MPLTKKGQEIMGSMKEQYGSEKGEQVFYASKNKGNISGVDSQDLPLQNLMDRLMQKFASKDRRTRDQANVPTRPTGKENDTMGTVMSGDESESSGGSAREAPSIRYQGKELKDLGTRISGDAKRAFFKGAFRDARRFLSIGDSFAYALDQMAAAAVPKPEGTQRAVKAPKAAADALARIRDAQAKRGRPAFLRGKR